MKEVSLIKQVELTEEEIQHFHRKGYVILREVIAPETLQHFKHQALLDFQQCDSPIEFENDVNYPRTNKSDQTVRRLLNIYDRSSVYQNLSTNLNLYRYLSQLFECQKVYLSKAHHNCLMTKSAQFSSETGWHQDIRYWSYQKDYLISAWFPLQDEYALNGGLKIIEGSHLMSFDLDQFDDRLFFKSDGPKNQACLSQKSVLSLFEGDILLFHSKLLHSASQNQTDSVKFSLVFTYYSEQNTPLLGTRSSTYQDILLEG